MQKIVKRVLKIDNEANYAYGNMYVRTAHAVYPIEKDSCNDMTYYVYHEMYNDVTDEQVADDETCACDWTEYARLDSPYTDDIDILYFDGEIAIVREVIKEDD